eukprot:m.105100 g.105100  ORF g.105100 m.105100 type:complete len:525 (+) comp27620_c0_seq4:193-1767(+)
MGGASSTFESEFGTFPSYHVPQNRNKNTTFFEEPLPVALAIVDKTDGKGPLHIQYDTNLTAPAFELKPEWIEKYNKLNRLNNIDVETLHDTNNDSCCTKGARAIQPILPRHFLQTGTMTAEEIVREAARCYSSEEPWQSVATVVYIQYCLCYAHRIPSLKNIALRLIARANAKFTYQLGAPLDNRKELLGLLKVPAEARQRDLKPDMLRYRKENQLHTILGSKIVLDDDAKTMSKLTQKDRLAIFSQNVVGKINLFLGSLSTGIAGLTQQDGMGDYDNQLMAMMVIVAEYINEYFVAQTAYLEETSIKRGMPDAITASARKMINGTITKPKIKGAPPKTYGRMFNKGQYDYADKHQYPSPSAQYNKDIIRIAVETATPSELVNVFEEIKRDFKVVGIKNPFTQTDEEAATASGLEMILLNVEFTPKKGKRNDGEPLTFKDMLDDKVGYKRAVDAAIRNGTPYREGIIEPFLTAIASKPIVVIAEIQLMLSFYLKCRKITHLYFKIDRAQTISALQRDCASYKDK